MTVEGLSDSPFLTVAEVAAALRVSKMSVYRFVNNRELPAVRVGRSIRIPLAAAKAFIERGGGGEDPRPT